ncbi:MAG: YceI family protein [Flavobacterium sp.]
MKKIFFLTAAAFMLTAGAFSQSTYTIDKYHTKVGFSATHFGISHVEGNFKLIDASLVSAKPDFTGAVFTFTAQVNSINTDVEYRDNDLKSSAYFDADKFPEITFKSTSFKKIKGKNYLLSGNISIHGVTRAITFNAVYNGTAVTAMKKPTAGFTIKGKLNRLDFSVGSDPLVSGVSNQIELLANIEFTVNK